MPAEILVQLGGGAAAAFAVFHLLFWKLFRWKTELAKLSSLNRAIVQILNLCLTFAFVIFAFVSVAHAREMVSTGIGHSLLLLVAVFWYLRAVEQVVFFGLRTLLSIGFFVVFVIGGSLYLAALLLS